MANRNTNDEHHDRDVDHDDQQSRGDEGRQNQFAQGEQNCQTVLRNDNSHQSEHTDRGVTHDNLRHMNHHVADNVEEFINGLTLFTHEVQAEAEHDGKEDDLKDGALSESFHRVNRNDVK